MKDWNTCKFTVHCQMENNESALPSEVDSFNEKMKAKLAIEVAKKILQKNAIKIHVRKK